MVPDYTELEMSKIETTLSAAQVAIAEALFAGTYGVTLGKREGNPTFIPVPVADMPENAIIAMFAYGVQRKFNDSVGGADTALADKVIAARAMVDDFLAGKVTKPRGSSEAVDPMVAEIRLILRPDVKAGWIKANSADGWKALGEDEIAAMLDETFAEQDDDTKAAIEAVAKNNLAAKAAMRDSKKGLKITLKV